LPKSFLENGAAGTWSLLMIMQERCRGGLVTRHSYSNEDSIMRVSELTIKVPLKLLETFIQANY